MNNNEPVILGKVKKGGSGKPIVVIIIFLFVGGIVFLLPTILNYFGDYSIIDLVKNGELVDFINNHDTYMNGSISLKKDKNTTTTAIVKSYINSKTILNANKFSLSDFSLSKEKISFKITVDEETNLNNDYYYLILTKNSNILGIIRIDGIIKDTKTINYTFKTRLETTIEIEAIIKKYNDLDYPTFTLSSDESGLASLYCKDNTNSYEYVFDNNKLIRIKETYVYKDNGNNSDYLNEFSKYTNISNEVNRSGNTSSLVEDNYGFTFNIDVDLTTYDKKINNNYYSYNTNSNKIKFDMDAKGYDCK